MIHLDKSVAKDELIIRFSLLHDQFRQRMIQPDDEEHSKPYNIGSDYVCDNLFAGFLVSGEGQPGMEH
jgi:hypothetical protein